MSSRPGHPTPEAHAPQQSYPVAKRDWAEEHRFEEGLKRLRRWIA